jgi:hypothetical protein
MESVEAIARKIVREHCTIRIEDTTEFLEAAIAAALTAERANTDTANAAAVTAYARVRELEALLDTAKSALAAERANTAHWKERAQRAEAEAMTLRDFERARNTVNRQTKAEAEL